MTNDELMLWVIEHATDSAREYDLENACRAYGITPPPTFAERVTALIAHLRGLNAADPAQWTPPVTPATRPTTPPAPTTPASPPSVEPLEITTQSPLPAATEGTDYTQRFAAKGGHPPYRWEVYGDIPAGLDFDARGVLDGIPADGSAGTFRFEIEVVDRDGEVVSERFRLTVLTVRPSTSTTQPPATPSRPASPASEPSFGQKLLQGMSLGVYDPKKHGGGH